MPIFRIAPILYSGIFKRSVSRHYFDTLVKSPDAALHCILIHCGVQNSTPHSFGFVRLACELSTGVSYRHLGLFMTSLLLKISQLF